MVFYPPTWIPDLKIEPPDSIPLSQFVLDDIYGRQPIATSRDPFTCGISEKTYSIRDVKDRVKYLARELAREFSWSSKSWQPGTELSRILAIYSINTIDTLTVTWATHELSGVVAPISASATEDELVYQLKASGAKGLITCHPLAKIALGAARRAGIHEEHVYILSTPDNPDKYSGPRPDSLISLRTIDDLIEQGRARRPIAQPSWSSGQARRQVAFLCFSSGTSGLPASLAQKGVKISHYNVIANILQMEAFERPYRNAKRRKDLNRPPTEVALGLLPQSHIFALVVVCHACVYRGDQVIVMPKYELIQLLKAVQRFRIETLFVVPPILIALANNPSLLSKYDLGSISTLYTGAAPLSPETADTLRRDHPTWQLRNNFGMTEAAATLCSTAVHDIFLGSSGSLLPEVQAKLISPSGQEITTYDEPGELVVKSPSIVLGYLDNEPANAEAFSDGWLRTGDEALVRKSPAGYEHFFIVDRIKEMIKVKGMQVAPAELESLLLTHPEVADAAIIPIPDDIAGERPKAFVVRKTNSQSSPATLKLELLEFVKKKVSHYKWISELSFVDSIPKSPSGKILRRLLRDAERQRNRRPGAKL